MSNAEISGAVYRIRWIGLILIKASLRIPQSGMINNPKNLTRRPI